MSHLSDEITGFGDLLLIPIIQIQFLPWSAQVLLTPGDPLVSLKDMDMKHMHWNTKRTVTTPAKWSTSELCWTECEARD